jgi:IS5 family transposase
VVYADAGYAGADKRVKRKGLKWKIAMRPGRLAALPEGRDKRAVRKAETAKARIRAKVEHPFRVVKRQFGYVKVRFKGLAKNTAHVLTLFALANLWLARKKLLPVGELRPQMAR